MLYEVGLEFIDHDSATSNYSQSPEVSSPIGLAALPAVMPLASPVDFCADQQCTDILGAQEPTSGSPQSQMQIAVDTKLPESPSIESLTSSQHSFTTIISPQDSNWDQPFQGDILAVKLPDSPNSEHLSSPVHSSSASSSHFRHDGELRAVRSHGSVLFTLHIQTNVLLVSTDPQVLPRLDYRKITFRRRDLEPLFLSSHILGSIVDYASPILVWI